MYQYTSAHHRGVFPSFFSGGFIITIVVNPSERKLAKRTSVHCTLKVIVQPHQTLAPEFKYTLEIEHCITYIATL